MKKGLFITFEGGEGCGKTTQIRLLADYISSLNYDVNTSREPGGDPFAEAIRKALKEPAYLGSVNPVAELFGFMTSRAQFAAMVVKPNIEKGIFVLSDRGLDSSVAYQGYGRGLPIDMINNFNRIAMQGIMPDLTFFLDTPVKVGLGRVDTTEFGQKDRFEREGLDFHERVRQGYLTIARRDPRRVKVIYSENDSIDEKRGMIRWHVMKKIAGF